MEAHPVGVGVEAGDSAGVEVAARGRADVHEQVAAARDMVDEHLDAHLRRLPARLVAVVAPGTREGLAAFPDADVALVVAQRLGRDILLGGDEGVGVRIVEAVVDDDVGLEAVDEVEEFGGTPVVMALAVLAGIREVEPEDVDLAVVREEFRDLVAHVLAVLRHVAPRVELVDLLLRKVAVGVEPVDDEVGVVPVDEGVVEADVEALGAEGVDDLAEQVAPGGGVGGLVVGVLGVEEAEALVVLRRDDEVLHAGGLGLGGPGLRVEEIGVEEVEVDLVLLVVDVLDVLDPLVAGGH